MPDTRAPGRTTSREGQPHAALYTIARSAATGAAPLRAPAEHGRARKRRGPGASTPGPRAESALYFRAASFIAFAIRNFSTRLAGILMASPVWGLRPMRALRLTTTSFPTPGKTKPFFASLAA